MSTTYERELREYEENVSDFWKSIIFNRGGSKAKNVLRELCAFILKRFDTLVKLYIGIEWELQGSIPTKECKGKVVRFSNDGSYFSAGQYDCIIGIDDDELKKIANKHGLYKIYVDAENIEFSSSPVEATQHNLENSFVKVNEAVLDVLKLLEEIHTVPIGLFLPNSYIKSENKYVSKHINISVFIQDPLEKIIRSNPVRWKKYDLVDIKYVVSRRETLPLGYKSRILNERIHINVPYNYRLYIDLTEYVKGIIKEQLRKTAISQTDSFYYFIIEYAYYYYPYRKDFPLSELFLSILTYGLTHELKSHLSKNIELFIGMNEQQYGIQEEPTLIAYIRPHGKPVLVNPVY
jgi:hypothetical protein